MAWEWSHSPEAYENAKKNLTDLSQEVLATIYSEIIGYKHDELCEDGELTFKYSMYEAERQNALKREKDFLIGFIWAFMEDFRTCDNGGYNAYACPHGCHTVSFDREGT